MKVHSLRAYGFTRTALLDLIAAVNKFCEGQAVTNVETGTVAYNAGESKNKELVSQNYQWDGTKHSAILWYTE